METDGSRKPAIEILSRDRANVFLVGPLPGPELASLVRYLDCCGIRVIGDAEGMELDPVRLRRIIGDCSGLISFFRHDRSRAIDAYASLLRGMHSEATSLPHLILAEKGLSVATTWSGEEGTVSIDGFVSLRIRRSLLHGPEELSSDESELPAKTRDAVDTFVAGLSNRPIRPAYAFMIGRLERDFAHAREAIRAAIEQEAGIPCLWSGDGRYRLKTQSVREATQYLLENATLVIADLTLGPENPEKENPSRAHEIGLAVAFGHPLMLCSREPRRYPYFSIGDLQMFFWSDERDLYERAKEWLRTERGTIGRTVLNHRLSDWDPTCRPNERAVEFKFDPARRYLWPLTRPFSDLELLAISASVGSIALSVSLAAGLQDRLGPALYAAAGLVAALALVALPRLTPRLRAFLGRAAGRVPSLLALCALILLTLVFLSKL